jgi:hypothetical protein
MLQTFKQLLAHHLDRCPDAAWDAPVANLTFSQVALFPLHPFDAYASPCGVSFDVCGPEEEQQSWNRGS